VTDEEILAAIEEVARGELGYEGRLEPGLRVVEDLRLDSLGLLTLAMEIENRFDVTLDEIDPASIERVADLVGAIRKAIRKKLDG
jgi:acyl carrier protein